MSARVLLIDDDPSFCSLARRVQTGSGLQVVGEAETAAGGAAEAARLRPDAILVDVGLPDRDGVHLAGRPRGAAVGPARPAVLL